MTTQGLDRQIEIYTGGSRWPIAPEEWERRAREALDDGPFDYLAGGAGAERTIEVNRAAFERWRIWPRMLRDTSDRDLALSLSPLSSPFPVPFLLAPIGVLSILHPEAERGVARAAASAGVPMIVSTASSTSIEDIAAEIGDTPRWFQLYPALDPEISYSLIHRAENAGYGALVVTVDTTTLGWRERDLRNAYLPFLRGEGIANYVSDPVFRSQLPQPPEEDPAAAVRHFLQVYVNPKFSWENLAEIRRRTRLPILVKGILRPDDAQRAAEMGLDGIVVSNHGGRQVDGAIASLDAMASVREDLPDELILIMDGGIRRGSDIVKALALGARAVLLGRPYAYGLAAAGETGVLHVIRNLIADLDLTMALSGCRTLADLDASLVGEGSSSPLSPRGREGRASSK